MGRGLSSAKTLRERSGEGLFLATGSDSFAPRTESGARRGAIVEGIWPREKIDAVSGEYAIRHGQNPQIDA